MDDNVDKEEKMREMKKKQMEKQQQEMDQMKKKILREALTPEARERLSNARLSNSDLVEQVEAQIVRLYQMGQINGKITEPQLKKILKQSQSKTDWNIKRR
ncbi:MAG: DNA-binding protein [Candidatus Aenigmatarchaeota archaeon]